MDQIGELERLIGPVVAGLGYELVRVQVTGSRQATLQVMAERVDRRGMRVEDCALISRELSAMLDVADPIAGAYTLEVSSPGIDRPLMKLADYVRFAGHDAKVEVEPPMDGRRRFQGAIAAVEGDAVRLETPTGPAVLPFSIIKQGKLVLTDRLIAAATAERDDGDYEPAVTHAA